MLWMFPAVKANGIMQLKISSHMYCMCSGSTQPGGTYPKHLRNVPFPRRDWALIPLNPQTSLSSPSIDVVEEEEVTRALRDHLTRFISAMFI